MIEEKIKNDIEYYKKEIERMISLVDILENKKINTEEFEKYKSNYFSLLNHSIPTTMGRGSERFRKNREIKIDEINNIKREFNEYFNL